MHFELFCEQVTSSTLDLHLPVGQIPATWLSYFAKKKSYIYLLHSLRCTITLLVYNRYTNSDQSYKEINYQLSWTCIIFSMS